VNVSVVILRNRGRRIVVVLGADSAVVDLRATYGRVQLGRQARQVVWVVEAT